MKKTLLIVLLVIGGTQFNFAQQRINTYETVSWFGLFNTSKINNRFSLHTELQLRRAGFILENQQAFARLGLNYLVNPRVFFRLGYAYSETFPYGEIPLNGFGKDFTEHRPFQMVALSHKEGKIDFNHRFMLEQRFIGKYSGPDSNKEEEFPLYHRFRYMFRLQFPLKDQSIGGHTPYLAIYNELMIGFGKNIQANVFDQNRIVVLLGYQLNNQLRLEGGYINQTLQFGRLIEGKNVFQHNNGLIVNVLTNLNFIKLK